MKHKYLLIALVLSLGLLLLNTACGDKEKKQVSEPEKEEVSGPMMLADEDPPVTALDKSMVESKKPMPFPGEELQMKAKADAALMSAMEEDIKPEEEKELDKAIDPNKPRPIPEEPPPPEKTK
jgi:hypothetical protein